MWHLMIQCGEKGFVCWSAGRNSVGRSVWRDTLDCTLDRETFHCHCGESFALKRGLKIHTERLCSKTVNLRNLKYSRLLWYLPIDTAAHTSTPESSPQKDCLLNWWKFVKLFYFMYLIISIFLVNVCYRSILCSSSVSQLMCCHKLAGVLQFILN